MQFLQGLTESEIELMAEYLNSREATGEQRYVTTVEEAALYVDPHICTACRYRADDMLWRCPHCHEWNTFVEERVGPAAGGQV